MGKRHEQGQEKSMESMINTAMFCKCHSGKGGLKPSGVPTSLRGTRGTKLRYQELGKSESVLHFYLSTLSLIKIEWTFRSIKDPTSQEHNQPAYHFSPSFPTF